MSPLYEIRWQRFKANKRGLVSLWLFSLLFILSLFAELIANDKPLLVSFDGQWYYPVAFEYAETDFGGEFEAEADYTDPYVKELIEEKGYLIYSGFLFITTPLITTSLTPPHLHQTM